MGNSSVPTEQWAQVMEEKGKPSVYKKIPVQAPGPGEILTNIIYSGVCHTDVHTRAGDMVMKPKFPVVAGHEGVGVVVAVGEGVTDFEVGDYAGMKWVNGVCGKCYQCRNGVENLCPNTVIGGYVVDGTYQQYMKGQATVATKIPKECFGPSVAPIMCAGVTVYRGIKRTNCKPGQYLAVVGAGGGLGSHGLQYAKAMGFRPIAIDGGAEKGKACMELGAEAYVDFEKGNVIEDLKKVTDGEGAHGAVIVSSEEEPYSHAADYVRTHGTVSIVGIPTDGYVNSQLADLVWREVTITGSLVGNRADVDEAVEYFRRGLINVPCQVVGLSKLNEVIDKLSHNEVIGRYVADTSK